MEKSGYLLVKAERKVFLLSIIVVLIFKLTLLRKGLMYFPDEYRYFSSTLAIKKFFGGDTIGGIVALNSTQGRPRDAVCRLLPAAVQAILFKIKGLNINTPASLLLNAWVNYIILLLNAGLFWLIARKLLKRELVVVAIILYICTVNYKLYIRHVLPYDEALCFFLIAMLLVLKCIEAEAGRSKVFWAGVSTGMCYIVYPGYFLAPVFLGILLLSRGANKTSWGQVARREFLLAAWFVFVIVAFEGLARVGGRSYLFASQTLSSTTVLGDFSAGYSFVPEYLIAVLTTFW